MDAFSVECRAVPLLLENSVAMGKLDQEHVAPGAIQEIMGASFAELRRDA